MKKKNIKFVQYGCGKMAVYTMKYAIEKGYTLVGAVDVNPDLIGKDVSVVLGGENLNVTIVSPLEAEQMMKKTKPDICIITTMSLMKDIEESLELCAKLGINAITTCEEAFYPFNSSPTITKKIDDLAKKKHCTITGSGYQDAFWGNLIYTIAGANVKITKIKGSSSYNVEDYGIALAKAHGAGLTLKEFEKDVASSDNIDEDARKKLIKQGDFLPSYMWNTTGWLCDKLGLTVVSQNQKCVPITYKKNLVSKTLNMTIKKGYATGMSAVVTTQTKEGITLEIECIGKVYSKTDVDQNIWTVYGEPTTNMVITKPDTVKLTCATIVNRILDVIDAEDGFVPTSRMGELKYRK